jgi:ABC-2 type transport system ATP-binding protein
VSDRAIETRGLTRRFGAHVAVDGLDLDVPRGSIFGFLGPNGSGKSTTIRMLCGLLTPSAGSARVLGLDIPHDAEALRARIGYMTQRFSLYDDLTPLENLRFMAAVHALPRRSRAARIDAQIARFGLAALRDQQAGTMSGGQRQRLALAAATLHAPELLFLDEPTSAVDPESRRQFWEALFDMAEAGTTLLVSTHFMDEAERCHVLAILDRGTLVASGAPRDLMRSIPAHVVEIEAAEPRRARALVAALPVTRSVAQIGLRLHALVDAAVEEPLAAIRDALAAAGIDARVDHVGASLEDVFVAATSGRRAH